MEKIRIVTDSASDILKPFPENLTVLPLTIRFGEEEFRDGVDMSHRQFYEKLLEDDIFPTTSLIPPAAFEEVFRESAQRGETVLVITLSGKLSGTFQSAEVAAEDAPGEVYVVDSRNVTAGERLLVEYALRMVSEGVSARQIVRTLEQARERIHILGLLDTLEYLKKGGRISKTVAFVGEVMAIKPVVTVANGEVAILGKARGSKNGSNFLIREIQNCGGVNFQLPYCLGYTGLSDAILQKYIADSEDIWRGHDLPIHTVGATIGTHVGPNAIVVAFFDIGVTPVHGGAEEERSGALQGRKRNKVIGLGKMIVKFEFVGPTVKASYGTGFPSLCTAAYLPLRPTLLGDFPACRGRRNASPTPLQIPFCQCAYESRYLKTKKYVANRENQRYNYSAIIRAYCPKVWRRFPCLML